MMFKLILFFFLSTAQAEETKQKSPFHFNYKIELPLTIASLAMTATPVLFQPEGPRSLQPPYDRNNVFFLDRPVTYYHSKSWESVGYGLTVLVPVTVVTASLPWGKKVWAESYEDLLMLTESMAFTSLTNQIVRNSFRRPRPYLYQKDTAPSVSDREDLSSFFSGHTAMAFALGISYWRIHSIRSPGDPANPYIEVAAITGGALMGVSRVYSGFHFWTDVLVGGVLGTAVGIIIPEMHRLDDGQPGSFVLEAAGEGGLAVGLRI